MKGDVFVEHTEALKLSRARGRMHGLTLTIADIGYAYLGKIKNNIRDGKVPMVFKD